MKQIGLFIIALTLICACKKKDEPMATPPVLSIHFVKYWKSDTLKNGLVGNSPTDSFYSFKHGDTSGITYGGTPVYVFSINEDTTNGSVLCYLSPTIDTAAAWSKGYVYPHKHWSVAENKYIAQKQAIIISNRSPHFATTGDAWYFGK